MQALQLIPKTRRKGSLISDALSSITAAIILLLADLLRALAGLKSQEFTSKALRGQGARAGDSIVWRNDQGRIAFAFAVFFFFLQVCSVPV